MGPRPIGRGNSGRPASAAPDVVASMGPRPIGRGNRRNGWRLHWSSPGFNGAATNWSRKYLLLLTPDPMETLLQWGRDQLVAEMGGLIAGLVLAWIASMGPRLIGRGNTEGTATLTLTYELQWGRDQLVAEIPFWIVNVNDILKLQWGRDQLVAEIRWPAPAAMRRSRASMGPRPIGRGNRGPCAPAPVESSRFNGAATNWSRKFVVLDVALRQMLRFNGAATNWSRKCDSLRTELPSAP